MSLNSNSEPWFFTFEGIEGAGKSTCLRLVAEALGIECLVTREPGSGDFGAQIRRLLLDQDELPQLTQLFLFLADRSHHVQSSIRPALNNRLVVLCDRYIDSTLVYQSGFSEELLIEMNQLATGNLWPSRTFLFDLEPRIAQMRIQNRSDLNHNDLKPVSFHESIRNGFLALASKFPDRYVVLDATLPVEQLSQLVLAEIRSVTNHHG